MAITLQAYALSDGNDVEVTLKIVKDLNEISEKSFILPKEKGAFVALTDELYDANEKPTYVTKKEFKEQFVDWTLNQNYEIVTADQITEKYNDVFGLTPEQALGFVDGLDGVQDLQGLVEAQKQKMMELLKGIQEGDQNILDTYKTNKESDESFWEDPGDPEEDPEEIHAFQEDPYSWTDPGTDAAKVPPQAINTDTSGKSALSAQANAGADTGGLGNVPFVAPLPKTKSKRPVVDQGGLSNQSVAILNGQPPGITNNLKGVAGDRLIEPVPAPIKYPGDATLEGENNALIQCGRDEVYRLKGHTQAGAIYAVAGRSPNNIKTEDKDSDNINPADNKALEIPNNLVRDAAYLYLSQKSDPETLLRVAGGTYAKKVGGPSPRAGLSLAAIKADDVVIMSRASGIRLITGTDKTNSSGGELVSKFGIELIAGNDDSDLQPLIKGNNLELYLTTLSEVVSNLRSVVYNFVLSQLELNAQLALHTHYDPFSIFLGMNQKPWDVPPGPSPFAFNGGKNYLSPGVLAAGTKGMLANAVQQSNIITGVMLKRINNDFNAFNPIGAYNIKSQKNKTN